MENDEDTVRNEGVRSLTYMTWNEHIQVFSQSQWESITICWAGLFVFFWGLIEALSFFYPTLSFSNFFVLFGGVFISFFGALFRGVNLYRKTVPEGLEQETSNVHKIAFSKKHYWEYALAYQLVKSRIQEIDQNLEDVVSNRIHIKVTKTMSVKQYSYWLETRPENLLRIVTVAKQLLIFDLIEAIHADESNEVDYHKLIRVTELIKDAYKSAYDFEVEGREIKIPKGFKVIHEIQAGWVSVVRDGYHQMLKVLQSVAIRDKGDFSSLKMTIVFDEPPRVEEFIKELDKIIRSMR